MLNSDLYSSVITGQKLIVVVCDNGGFAVIDRLQTGMGGRSFNNMLGANGDERVKVDWAAHAVSLGCQAEAVRTIGELEEAFARARANDRTTVIAIETAPNRWTPGGAFWEVGVAESIRPPGDRRRTRARARREAAPASRLVKAAGTLRQREDG